MRIIVCGGRDYADHAFVFASLNRMHENRPIMHLHTGDAWTEDDNGNVIRGADGFAKLWARTQWIPFSVWEADWDNEGKAAGPLRNGRMLAHLMRLSLPHCVVAFPGGKGTANMVGIAKAQFVQIWQPALDHEPPTF